MENKETSNSIDSQIATVSLLLQTKAYLRTMLDNQEKILAHLQGRGIKEIAKETDDLYSKYLKEETDIALKDYSTENFKK